VSSSDFSTNHTLRSCAVFPPVSRSRPRRSVCFLFYHHSHTGLAPSTPHVASCCCIHTDTRLQSIPWFTRLPARESASTSDRTHSRHFFTLGVPPGAPEKHARPPLLRAKPESKTLQPRPRPPSTTSWHLAMTMTRLPRTPHAHHRDGTQLATPATPAIPSQTRT